MRPEVSKRPEPELPPETSRSVRIKAGAAGGYRVERRVRNRKLFYRAVGMVHAEHLLPCGGDVGSHVDGWNPQPAGGNCELRQAVIAAAIVALTQHLFHFMKARVVARRPCTAALNLIVEGDRAALHMFCRVRHTVSGGDHQIGTDERNRARRQMTAVHVQDHADTARYRVTNVSGRRDAGDVLPIGWRMAEPERVVLRLGIGRITEERIAVRQCRRILLTCMPFAASVPVQLDRACRGAVSDVPDRHQAAGQSVNVDGTRPELGAVGRCEYICAVA